MPFNYHSKHRYEFYSHCSIASNYRKEYRANVEIDSLPFSTKNFCLYDNPKHNRSHHGNTHLRIVHT